MATLEASREVVYEALFGPPRSAPGPGWAPRSAAARGGASGCCCTAGSTAPLSGWRQHWQHAITLLRCVLWLRRAARARRALVGIGGAYALLGHATAVAECGPAAALHGFHLSTGGSTLGP